MKKVMIVNVLAVILGGCMSSSDHARQLPSYQERNMTVGIVQRDIRKGMTAAAVAEALGSPNIVSKDKDGKESWIYDRLATEAAYSAGSGGILSLLIGSRNAGAVSSTQTSLTVIIKFVNGTVSDYSYHSSRF